MILSHKQMDSGNAEHTFAKKVDRDWKWKLQKAQHHNIMVNSMDLEIRQTWGDF